MKMQCKDGLRSMNRFIDKVIQPFEFRIFINVLLLSSQLKRGQTRKIFLVFIGSRCHQEFGNFSVSCVYSSVQGGVS